MLGVNIFDLSLFAAVLISLLTVSAIALFIPTRKATRLSPLEALRYE